MLVVIIITMAVTVYLYIVIPKGFFPQQDTGRLNFTILADQNTSFSALDTRVRQVVRILMGEPAVAGLMAFMGSGGGGGGNVLNTSRGFLSLKPFEERKATPDQVIARLRPKLAAVPGTTVVLQAQQDLRVGGRNGAAQYQFTLIGDDFNELNRWGPRVLQKLKSLRQLADVSSDQQDRGLAASLVVDRATASRLGISTQNIDDTLYDAFGQRQVSTMYTQLNQYHVVMEVEPRFWNNPDGLKYIYVPSTTGQQVPLSAFTRYAASSTPLQVNHSGQFPSVTISFNLPLGVSLGDAVPAVDEAMREINLPGSIRASFQGTAQAFQESLKNEPLLILAALIAVYIVLGVLYESLIHPLTILSTLPSAGVGALLALIATHNELNVVSLIGIILLIGVVKKNAIMMIDFAIAAARQGKTPEAGHLRSLPAALPPHHDDHHGGAVRQPAAGDQLRHGIGAAPAAGYCDRGRPHFQPGLDALHHPRRVFVYGPDEVALGELPGSHSQTQAFPPTHVGLTAGSAVGEPQRQRVYPGSRQRPTAPPLFQAIQFLKSVHLDVHATWRGSGSARSLKEADSGPTFE